MPSRKSSQWQSRRKPSLGKLRRAHPASGATWNVQVVRGKMTSKCLWHACRALALGMVLMLLGAGMATIGYYADQLSVGQEIRGNATVRVKNESRGFHLNNLSYVGPIIMGFGGFIVVAACVMTFEARDSAAKVVPARFKLTNSERSNARSNNSSVSSARRGNEVIKNSKWEHHLGVFRTSPAEPTAQHVDRQALTAALVHFSKTMGNSPRQTQKSRKLSRSGSVPDLMSNRSGAASAQLSPYRKRQMLGRNIHHHHNHQGRRLSKSRSRISTSLVHRASRESTNSLLHPGMLHLQRHALSVDETGPFRNSSESPYESLTSVILPDSHEGRLRDRTKRSDTSKRHVLARQRPIEKEEPHSPKTGYPEGRRRSSTASDASYASRWIYRRASSASRTPSIDSRSVQVELHSPEKFRSSPRTPQRFNSGQSSTPSVELRSQLSVCSEPITMRQLSGQSSLEPCLLEESPELEDKDNLQEANTHINNNSVSKSDIILERNEKKKARPGSLVLDLSDGVIAETPKLPEVKKLQRSNSSKTFYRPKPRDINEFDQIYFISANGRAAKDQEDPYDSLQVINERRNKILKAAEIHKSETSLSDILRQPTKDITQHADGMKLQQAAKDITVSKQPQLTEDSSETAIESSDPDEGVQHLTINIVSSASDNLLANGDKMLDLEKTDVDGKTQKHIAGNVGDCEHEEDLLCSTDVRISVEVDMEKVPGNDDDQKV